MTNYPRLHPRNLSRCFAFGLLMAFLAPAAAWAADDNPATLLGDQTSYNGYKYGFQGFLSPNTKYLQQVVTLTNGGTKTTTTTVDPKTGQRSTSTSGSAGSDYGGSWNIQSDTSRQRSGSSGDKTSQTTTSSSNEYTTQKLKDNVAGWVPAFDGDFAADVDTALISLSPQELSYTITKLQYKWQVAAAGNDAVFWDVEFAPDEGDDVVHDQHGWATSNQTESQVYTVDPTALNGKAAGVYTVKLSNNDIIQVDAFIPQEWVSTEPESYIYVNIGDLRKDPIDASFDTGTAIYGRELGFRVRHRQTLTTLAQADPGSGIEASTVKAKCGLSQAFYASEVYANGGHITGLRVAESATAVPSSNVTIQHPSEGVVTITLEDSASDPLVVTAPLLPIHFQATITIDRSVPGQPTYHVTGRHCRFPAYEVYINNQRVHEYSPIPSGTGPILGLLFFDRTFDNSGGL